MGGSFSYLDLADPALPTHGLEDLAVRDEGGCTEIPYRLALLSYREVGTILRDQLFGQLWPVSEDAGFITGQVFAIDFGRTSQVSLP